MKTILKIVLIIISILFLNCTKNSDEQVPVKTENPVIQIPTIEKPSFYKGIDLSFQSELETYNVDYKDAK